MNKAPYEHGQAVMLYAVFIPLTVLFALGIMDYMVTNLRLMETIAAADLAAHAGAQSVMLQPDGEIRIDTLLANQVAADYFTLQAPPDAQLRGVHCEQTAGRPTCKLSAAVHSAGFLLPKTWINVTASGTLAYGVTRENQ